MPSVLAYWDIRGLAQPLRLLLNYVGEDFEDKKYSLGPAPEYSAESWLKEKFTLGLDFPNLPYYIDGDVKITQTNAIFRYIGNKYKLCGKTVEEQVRVDMMMEETMDIRNIMVGMAYSKPEDFSANRDGEVKKASKKMATLETFIGDRNFFVGDEVSLADFHIYEMLDQYSILEPTILDDKPMLKAFKDRFESLAPIKKYMESDKFMKSPFNNKMASFGNK